MNYGNLLRQHMNVSYEDISEICVSITTTHDFYPLCFIGYEDDDVVGVYSIKIKANTSILNLLITSLFY